MKTIFKLALAAALALASIAPTALAQKVERPKLVVGIIIDQMRWDYIYTYADRFNGGGFERLLGEGFSCQNTIVDYVPTITSVGHASVWTGTTPAVHGIAENSFYIYGKHVKSIEDNCVKAVGTDKGGHCSPINLLSTTIGDELKNATYGKGKVIAVALKDRAAVLPGGHGADAAYWFDSKAPGFITSTYYMDRLPGWVERFNKEHATKALGNPATSYRGVALTFDMAKAAISNEKLGDDDITDLLSVSVSTTDIVAHINGVHSSNLDSCYLELDRQLASFFRTLDTQVGRGNYLLFLTADHAGTNSYELNKKYKAPSGGWNYWRENKDYNAALKQQFGVDSLVKEIKEFFLYLNNDAIEAHHLDRNKVVAAVKKYFEADTLVDRVVDIVNIHKEVMPAEVKERIVKGYYPGRSGELFIMLKPGCYCGTSDTPGSNHGTISMDDSHIPFVMIGWGIEHGETAQRTGLIDIAPTVCALLHIQMPTGCLGKPIVAITK